MKAPMSTAATLNASPAGPSPSTLSSKSVALSTSRKAARRRGVPVRRPEVRRWEPRSGAL